ncbi:hypothetical protein A7U60_g7504 [Sanghuangporus baumii]|uniref:Uncharacterized protein n=1 Tax=Sanghuangporus baumii TaxID=108892 RepID=A0A9Q5HT61_SANBA|nr:hypothetical protein A7U60_g7504 [Sanghuangporus baumii]
MSPLAPSESVDAFLTWLAQPTNPVVAPGHGHAHTHAGHSHNHNHNRTHGGLGYVPQKGKVSSSEQQQQEYAARLRELARSPLEEMAKPLLVGGPIVPPRAQSEGRTSGTESGHESGNGHGHRHGHGHGHRKDGKEKEKKRERRRSTGDGGGGEKNGATPASDAATASAAKIAPQTVKAQ